MSRKFPISESVFKEKVEPLIVGHYIWKGRPPKVAHYQVFCAILYVLRTGIPWRDLPEEFGYWHTVYLRFLRGARNGLWWKVLMELQKKKVLTLNIVLADSTTIQVHRHGSGGLEVVAKA